MAVLGEIILFCFGLFVFIAGTITFGAACAFSGKGGWAVLVPMVIGGFIMWLAVHYGPIGVVVS